MTIRKKAASKDLIFKTVLKHSIDPLQDGSFWEWSWFKFTNLGLSLGIALKFYTNVAKELKLKVRKFFGIIITLVEVMGGNLVGGEGIFYPLPPPCILNRVQIFEC